MEIIPPGRVGAFGVGRSHPSDRIVTADSSILPMNTDRMTADGEESLRIFLFESSTHVLWAEEVAREEGIPVEVISAPEEAGDSCGLALRTLREREEALAALLREEEIPFRKV